MAPEKKPLTPKQQKVLDYIVQRISTLGSAPTIREIADFFGFSSTNTPRRYLTALIQKGYLQLTSKRKARGIELLPPATGIPILGRVSAGRLKDNPEFIDGYFNLAGALYGQKDLYILTIRGDSMDQAGLLDGDLVIVKKQNNANNNDIVVALVDSETTIKTYYHTPDGIILKAQHANPDKYPPITGKNIELLGVVVAAVRNYKLTKLIH
mgnify:CR=1 FL=1